MCLNVSQQSPSASSSPLTYIKRQYPLPRLHPHCLTSRAELRSLHQLVHARSVSLVQKIDYRSSVLLCLFPGNGVYLATCAFGPVLFFFLNDPAPPEIYPLPLHDPLPISFSTSWWMMNGLNSSTAIALGRPHWCSLSSGPTTITDRPE